MDALFTRAAFARAPQLRAAHADALLAAADGDLARCLDPEILARVEIPAAAYSWLLFPDSATLTSDLEWIRTSGARLIASTDAEYPPQLRQLDDAPTVLFVLGDPSKLGAPQLAMVGSRSASPYGRGIAHEYASYYALAGLTITSGLALGIDAASHRGALASAGATVAVCGTGLDQVYPIQHNELAARIRATGALVSAFPPGTPPRQANFPQRNRLISGLSLGTLVVEATVHSGSLSTARHARKQGRKVFAIPGSITSALSAGCHQLIRDGARLVQHPRDVLLELKIPTPNEGLVRRKGRGGPRRAMDKGYEMLLDAVGFGPVSVDVLAVRTGLPGDLLASMLLVLELEGRIAPYPGGQFGRIP
ncbi:MAG TPA: DNA-processing protein DprA [Steroidobacteraceae bacterium]|nr:DNA-processing protein DprA [Steroidobacteraceae bacterium]